MHNPFRLLWLLCSLLFITLGAMAQEEPGLFRLDADDLARDTLQENNKIVSASRSLKE